MRVGSTLNTGESGFPETKDPRVHCISSVMSRDSYILDNDNIFEDSHLPTGEPSDIPNDENVSDTS